MKNDVLDIIGIQFGYDSAFFAPFDFSLNAGEVVALLGPNGVGKSTFLKTCSGELKPLSGSVNVCGKNVADFAFRERSKKIARVRPAMNVPPRMTVSEFVMLGRSAYADFLDGRSKGDQKIVEASLELADAKCFTKRILASLSDGEKARVFLAEALAREPSVLLLDEPTAFLDVPHVIALFKLLKQVAEQRQCGILVCTHQLEYALKYSDRVVVFEKDHDVFCGTSEEARQSGMLKWAEVE